VEGSYIGLAGRGSKYMEVAIMEQDDGRATQGHGSAAKSLQFENKNGDRPRIISDRQGSLNDRA
jgi:hypothetical protein